MTTTELLQAIKTVGSMVDGDVDDTDLLSMADREMMPLLTAILSVKEEYLVETNADLTLDANFSVRIPARAIGGRVRDVRLVSGGNEYDLDRIDMEDARKVNGKLYARGTDRAYFFKGGRIYVVNNSLPSGLVRLSYFATPGKLVLPTAVATVTNIAGNVITVSGVSLSGQRVDIVKGSNGYESIVLDKLYTWVVAGADWTIDVGSDAASLGIEVGDYVCPKNTAPVAQLPELYHPVLVQRTVCKALESIGDEGLANAQVKLQELETAALGLISERDDGEADYIVSDMFC